MAYLAELGFQISLFTVRMLKLLSLLAIPFLIVACGRHSTVCEEGSVTYFPNLEDISSLSDTELIPTPALVEIAGKMTKVDRVIRGPICADTWSGTIYVSCDIQLAEWNEEPRFFEECPLVIKPNTKIYVASHNDTAYYKGCSCHTGELTQP